jgi:hypothetical protein
MGAAAEHALASMLPATTTTELDDLEPIASSSGWPISLLFLLFLAISVAFEKGIKRAEAALERRGSAGLLRALRSALNELLVFGVLSLTLSFLSPTLARICVPIAAVGSDGGSGLSGGNGDDDPQQAAATAAAVSAGGPTTPLLGGGGGGHAHARRLLSGGSAALVECPAGRAPLYTAESIHDSHVFLLFVAVSHIAYSAATMALCLWRVNRWRRWEEEAGEEEGGGMGGKNSSSAGGAEEGGSGGGRLGAWARRAARPARRALRGLKQRLDDRKKAAESSSPHHHHLHHHHHNDHVLAAPTRVLRLSEGVVAALGRNRPHAALLATVNQYRVGISEPIYLGIRRLFMERLAAAAAAGALEAEGGKEEEDEEGRAAAEAPPKQGGADDAARTSPSPSPSQAPAPKLALAFNFHTFLRRSFELEFAGITDVEASLLFVGAAIVAVPPIFRAWALAGAALFAALMMAVVGAKLQGVMTQLAAQSHFLFGREALVAEVDALVKRQRQREGEEEEAAAAKKEEKDGGDGAFAGVLGQANEDDYDGGADMRARITPTFAGLGVRSPPRLGEEEATATALAGAPGPRPHPPALLVPAPDDGSAVAAAEAMAEAAADAAASTAPPPAAATAAAANSSSLATTSAPSVPLSSPQRVRQAQRAAFAGRPSALLMMPPSPVAGVSHSSNRSERTAAAAAAAAGLLGSARSPSPTPRPAAKALRRTTRHIGRQHDNLRHRLAPAGRRPLGPFGRSKHNGAGGAEAAGAGAATEPGGVTADALFWFGKPRLLLAAAKLAYFLFGFMLAIVLFAAYKLDGVLAAASMGWQLAAGLGLAAAAAAMTLHNALHVLPCFALVMTSAREATAQAASFLQQQQAAREAEALMARPCAGEWLAAALAREARAQRELRRERRRRREGQEEGEAARVECPLPAGAAGVV